MERISHPLSALSNWPDQVGSTPSMTSGVGVKAEGYDEHAIHGRSLYTHRILQACAIISMREASTRRGEKWHEGSATGQGPAVSPASAEAEPTHVLRFQQQEP
jgi:hypothetical protein